MPEQVKRQSPIQAREAKYEALAEDSSADLAVDANKAKAKKLDNDMDSILDEIDAVLTENEVKMAQNYKQQNGQ